MKTNTKNETPLYCDNTDRDRSRQKQSQSQNISTKRLFVICAICVLNQTTVALTLSKLLFSFTLLFSFFLLAIRNTATLRLEIVASILCNFPILCNPYENELSCAYIFFSYYALRPCLVSLSKPKVLHPLTFSVNLYLCVE